MEKLKPCPFCGNTDGVKIEPHYNPLPRQDGYEFGCHNLYCAMQPTGWAETAELAVEIWNMRAN